jgi:hypothetical protein
LNEDDIVVDLTVDVTINAQGRVIGYTTPSGERLEPRIRRGVEKILLFTEFNPSTTFGQPGSGKVPVTFRSSKIDVKG